MIMYVLELSYPRSTMDKVVIEADEHSLLDDLNGRICYAFKEILLNPEIGSTYYSSYEFSCNGKVYIPGDTVSQVVEMSFETYEPSPHRDEPDWNAVYQPLENVRLEDVFTTLGSAVNYERGGVRIRITLIDRYEAERQDNSSVSEEYDNLEEELRRKH